VINVRPSLERGHANHGWLDTRHTFSFARYYDPRQMGFRALRVINEDRVQPGRGFGEHSHRDMEILTYVVEGALAHADSTGHRAIIAPGDVQRMSAGTGVTHSEYNASETEPVHLLQIWIVPEENGLAPGYEQRHFRPEDKRGTLRLIAAGDGRDGALAVHQDVDLFAALLEPGERVRRGLAADRHAWVQLISGAVLLNGTLLEAGDGAAMSGEDSLEINPVKPSELLLFDLS
jgi:redox-sensitive bicupin YhaK (pirin superfamily)